MVAGSGKNNNARIYHLLDIWYTSERPNSKAILDIHQENAESTAERTAVAPRNIRKNFFTMNGF
jgi:hypothetical protein